MEPATGRCMDSSTVVTPADASWRSRRRGSTKVEAATPARAPRRSRVFEGQRVGLGGGRGVGHAVVMALPVAFPSHPNGLPPIACGSPAERPCWRRGGGYPAMLDELAELLLRGSGSVSAIRFCPQKCGYFAMKTLSLFYARRSSSISARSMSWPSPSMYSSIHRITVWFFSPASHSRACSRNFR
jgi:hypothetical protein